VAVSPNDEDAVLRAHAVESADVDFVEPTPTAAETSVPLELHVSFQIL
jgi:hypothetical protein